MLVELDAEAATTGDLAADEVILVANVVQEGCADGVVCGWLETDLAVVRVGSRLETGDMFLLETVVVVVGVGLPNVFFGEADATEVTGGE